MTPFKVKMKQKPLKQSADLCQLSQDWRSIQRSIDHVCKRRERYWTHRPTTHATGGTWAQADMDTGAVRNLNKSNHRSSSGQAAADKAKKEKSQQIPAVAGRQFYIRKKIFPSPNFSFPKSKQQWILQEKANSLSNRKDAASEETPTNQPLPFSNFRKMIFPTQKSCFSASPPKKQWRPQKEEIPANPSSRHTPISHK